jgi:hypothetical protein
MSDSASNPETSGQEPSRRRFLKGGAALGAALFAGAGLPIAARAQPAPDDPSKVLGAPIRPYGERSRFEQSVRERSPISKTDEWASSLTPLDETLGIITPVKPSAFARHMDPWPNAFARDGMYCQHRHTATR